MKCLDIWSDTVLAYVLRVFLDKIDILIGVQKKTDCPPLCGWDSCIEGRPRQNKKLRKKDFPLADWLPGLSWHCCPAWELRCENPQASGSCWNCNASSLEPLPHKQLFRLLRPHDHTSQSQWCTNGKEYTVRARRSKHPSSKNLKSTVFQNLKLSDHKMIPK